MRVANRIAIGLIRLYQKTASKLLRNCGVQCLHYPSCSQYAILAYQRYGCRRATAMAWLRLINCRPFSDRSYLDYP
jgi:putative membrane protein insertion efficiency factor